MMDLWDEVKWKYPNIKDVLDDIYRTQLVLLDKINDLDEHYPVEGYEWDCNPNDIEKCNPWGLRSKEVIEESIARADAALAKQRVCVEGTHHFQNIGHFKWCKYCGTIEIDGKRFYPEHPHFLPREDENS
ncbi:MAG: hypothetical protein NC548_49690 [Lachnospiraceae bacterium]|nr:hypothetical protein [Lachnospiraceae bacterium]